MTRRKALVTTTINLPTALDDYLANFSNNGHGADEIFVTVVGDRKTPGEVGDYCRTISRNHGFVVDYLDLELQKRFLAKVSPELGEYLPFDSIQRRNIGLLWAYEKGSEVIITIDDDNLVAGGDYLLEHSVVGTSVKLPAMQSPSGWLNVCSGLSEACGQEFYHRGYPPLQRWTHPSIVTTVKEVNVAVNAGLWSGDPDVDAIARLHRPLNVTGFAPGAPRRFTLDRETWSPFNSQNTSLARRVVPAYFLSPCVGRYDDIWASYIIMKIADHLGDSVSFGAPLVNQKRNVHNLWRDLDNERAGWQLTDSFVSALRAARIHGSGYRQCARSVLTELQNAFARAEMERREYLYEFVRGYELWIDAFDFMPS